MKWLIVMVFFIGCCPKQNYTGWKKVENPYYQDTSTDSVWVYVENGDYWYGIWEGKTYLFHLVNDTLFIKQKE